MSFGGNISLDATVKIIQTSEAETAPELITVKSAHMVLAKKTSIGKDIEQSFHPGHRTPVRRTKSDGQVRAACPVDEQSAVPRVSIDATINDRLWSKLDPSTHRDSVSSSSSISSNDTVIDLSLPNLARKSLTCLRAARDCHDNQDSVANWSYPSRSSTNSSMLCVSKSKSNPNLREGQMCESVDELLPRQLGTEHDNKRIMQRRHTWSRLYIEGLKQSSAASIKKAPTTPPKDINGGSKSKSLGDLTSEDIVCNFDSKYRSISRSFVVRPTRHQRSPKKTQDDLTERLKKLTDVEPLTSSDFTSHLQDSEADEKEEEQEEAPPLRRSSSRSQSRVRYIANRARQAQERQRLQSLLSGSNSPIEERGIPEGACSITRSPCANLDLLSQLPSRPPQQSSRSPDSDVFFMLRL
ncbi:1-phosphatidylinositol 4,5-bisphosphate phosphodiesterase eta-2 [Bagarius yarrelli]|uniref:1-phosphatidylinositol 4,5-bisphosphate phosphodiesterase eta-2 n=1 Tax=Bagarius yarrelli TaxID=175774 RepID=A0A556U231_BAGYA|nr:1-phosphatidylinositol 4,5-bisphosphate phosphodiesterase eta-2 [Bagarius yarrelli]